MGKSYKINKHTNKIHILQKYTIKINILKLNSNKKCIVLLTWSGESLIKFELEHKYLQTKCWDGLIYDGGLIYDKIRGVVLFIAQKNWGGRRNGGGREEGRLSDHKLNITNEFTDGFKYVSNLSLKTTWIYFFFFHYNFLGIYQWNIFIGV